MAAEAAVRRSLLQQTAHTTQQPQREKHVEIKGESRRQTVRDLIRGIGNDFTGCHCAVPDASTLSPQPPLLTTLCYLTPLSTTPTSTTPHQQLT